MTTSEKQPLFQLHYFNRSVHIVFFLGFLNFSHTVDLRSVTNCEFLDYQSMDIAMREDPAIFDHESFWGNMASMKNKVRIILYSWEYPLT